MSSITFLSVILLLLTAASQSYQYCPPIEPPEHGFVKANEDDRHYEFSCEDTYTLQGQSFVSCNTYDLENLKPRCIKHVCKDPPNPVNGQVDCDGEGLLVPGKSCRFSCFSGYELEGSKNIMCKFNLQWSGSAECISIPRTLTSSAEEICETPSPPENGRIECDEGDLTLGKRCRFSCFEGYKLQGAEVRLCMSKNRWSGNVKCISLPDSAHPEPANENRRVHHRTSASKPHYSISNYETLSEVTKSNSCRNLSCEQLCLIGETGLSCKCCAGYKLNTDKRTCKLNNLQRVNMNECLYQYQKVGDVELRPCPEGYIFKYERNGCIEKAPKLPSIPSSPKSFESCTVRNGGCEQICRMTASQTVLCACQSGYELQSDGKHCIDIDECSIQNFGCSDTCVNIFGSARCFCPKGLKLDSDRKTCIDVDECSSNENRCEHFCNNTHGSYFCSCKPSYILIEGYKCEGCRKNSYWSYERSACVDCPRNSHTDSEGKTTLKDCVCNSGYLGSPGDYDTCEDIDECSVQNFGCSGQCVNIPGSAYCICPKGFELDNDNKTCIDIDECQTKNGGCEGLCINTNGSFYCICPEGFIASNKDRYSCDDIDECSENNGGCENQCKNYHGGFYCACEAGYRLDSSLKKCTAIQCPRLPEPHYSSMNCTYRNASLLEEISYPAGTQCTFKCEKGFKNARDHNKMLCKNDGSWKGILPECKPESCPPLKVLENGAIHPPSCSKRGATVKEKCSFTCNVGYKLKGFPVFNCKRDLTWNKEDIPQCIPVKVQPVIKCPEDIQVTLSQGESKHNITVSKPTTNMESYEVHPSWVSVNECTEFPVGLTQITFIADSSSNETARCGMTVTVLDEEPPVFHSCPDPIRIEGAKGIGEYVTWQEPVVTDNVELISVFSILEPNTTFAPGTYFVEYVARDSSGNTGTCSFEISIIRMNCSDLRDPAHGKANCMDWMFGKLCNPECDEGYMRDPEDPLYYSCDDTGLWEPNDFITECLQYKIATLSACEDGFEYKKVDDTGEVCIKCPSNAVWSSTARKCEK